MIELKTLKNLESLEFCMCGSMNQIPCIMCDNTYEVKNAVWKKDVKQEAIKLIQNSREIKEPITEEIFMWWCNITEEDLK